MTALLLALLVTRHLTSDIIGPCNPPDPCPYVGLCVDGIAPTTTAIRIRPIGGGWTDSHEVDPLSGRIACIGIAVPRLGTPWYEAQEFDSIHNTYGPWTPEVPLACYQSVPDGGCDPTLYHQEVP